MGFARLGQVVSRKVDKRAVQRNRIKRLVRESFRRQKAGAEQGIDFVVLAHRHAALEPDNNILLNSIDQLWQQIEKKLYRQNPSRNQDL